ncbi:MAG: thermonuclease family protein [Proteobacteria bacterium]|jgi:endonuclease YncB( thermonuclease family)|uniref:Thermonuclease family protein n=1 Tax=Candidatus Fonsibacter lacus TaxID=2576439 RepID=A0A964UZ97_9PROT|nr:thermonuclease family protein [Candidatus Fonsibacter lacus]NBV40074.1 thermonuclease family protein [Candidatus Fonsibacter lacus]NBY89315.1 thermonuclease family protein [Candidatus Fonsibacter lacus]NCU69955.1 thermonuclease family protein [Candidatus Fonsibacter lacus]NCU73803.1 thermonuclease family protein [Candidatus Fonsibacter lacus]
MKKIIWFFIFSFFLSITSIANEKKIQVVDGDTIHIGNLKYRFFGIDAPEKKQICEKDNIKIQCGVIAKNVLKNKIGDKIPECIVKDKDRYQRLVAECFIGKESLSRFMVREGYAVAYTQYSKDFIDDEKYAKENKLGIWSMNFQLPSEYRKSLRNK